MKKNSTPTSSKSAADPLLLELDPRDAVRTVCITIWTPRVLAVLIYEFSSNLIPFKECFDSPDNR